MNASCWLCMKEQSVHRLELCDSPLDGLLFRDNFSLISLSQVLVMITSTEVSYLLT